MTRHLAALLAALAFTVAQGAAAAPLDQIVGQTIRANYGALHGCFRKSLAQDRGRGGTLFLTITLGAADSVHSVKVEKDGLGHKATSACILGWVRGWTFRGAAGAGAGMRSAITIPLTFRPAPQQFAVRLEDTAIIRGDGLQRRELLTVKNSGAAAATMSWVKVDGKTRLPALRGDRVLYILQGQGRHGAARPRRRPLRAGNALWASGAAGLALKGELEGVLVEVPGSKVGSARPVRGARRGPGIRVGGAARVWPLLTPRRLKHRRIYAGRITLERGLHAIQAVPQAELLYVLSGSAEVLQADGTAQHITAGHALYTAPNTKGRRIKVRAPLGLLQIFVPAGPERSDLKQHRRRRP